MADYYDLVVGLRPDQALRSVAESAGQVTVLVVPCCNFWTRDSRLGRDELIEQVGEFHRSRGGASERVTLAFSGPANHGLILRPPPWPSAYGGVSYHLNYRMYRYAPLVRMHRTGDLEADCR